ncbi:unnamed protein product [Soboliphyme baturini]|uniref:C2H2-type domain-containing protein n=1 Tax=Soboliphyme baturini TaxID=241478 RepID=A0A183IXG6_9BILA|nr:unnamed protein product [Soboliphyme baturini]
MRSHAKVVHGADTHAVRPYRCSCGKSYKTATGLQNHVTSSRHLPQTPTGLTATVFKNEYSRASPSSRGVKSSVSLSKSYDAGASVSSSTVMKIAPGVSQSGGRFQSNGGTLVSGTSSVGIHVQVQQGSYGTPSAMHSQQQQMSPLSPLLAVTSGEHGGQGSLASPAPRFGSIKNSYSGSSRNPRRRVTTPLPQQHVSNIVIQNQNTPSKIVAAGVSSKGFGNESFTTYGDSNCNAFSMGNMRISSPKR